MLVEWAKRQKWWGVVEALLGQQRMAALVHVPGDGMPAGLSQIRNPRTGSFVQLHACSGGGGEMHIILAASLESLDAAAQRLLSGEDESGVAAHRDPTSLPGMRGFHSPEPGEA